MQYKGTLEADGRQNRAIKIRFRENNGVPKPITAAINL
jgi:hypothetical protein